VDHADLRQRRTRSGGGALLLSGSGSCQPGLRRRIPGKSTAPFGSGYGQPGEAEQLEQQRLKEQQKKVQEQEEQQKAKQQSPSKKPKMRGAIPEEAPSKSSTSRFGAGLSGQCETRRRGIGPHPRDGPRGLGPRLSSGLQRLRFSLPGASGPPPTSVRLAGKCPGGTVNARQPTEMVTPSVQPPPHAPNLHLRARLGLR